MKFDLENGGHTIIFFYKDIQGKTHPFPMENADIVNSHGTKEDKEMLEKILTRARARIWRTSGGTEMSFLARARKKGGLDFKV